MDEFLMYKEPKDRGEISRDEGSEYDLSENIVLYTAAGYQENIQILL